jgi:hypothetical protein
MRDRYGPGRSEWTGSGTGYDQKQEHPSQLFIFFNGNSRQIRWIRLSLCFVQSLIEVGTLKKGPVKGPALWNFGDDLRFRFAVPTFELSVPVSDEEIAQFFNNNICTKSENLTFLC